MSALKKFIAECIPYPELTENRLWSVSICPTPRTKVRINAGQQEVFTVFDEGGEGGLVARPLSAKWLNVPQFIDGPLYKSNSFAYFVELSEFDSWLIADRVLAIRELVIWLMRHTTTLNNGSHCPQAIRTAFE